MAVQACVKPNMMDDTDDEDMPLVFKRSSSAAKQNSLNSAAKKSSSQRHDGPLGKHVSDVRSPNGQNSFSQKGKPVPSTKASPLKSPSASPKPSISTAKASSIETSVQNSKKSTSVADQSKHSAQRNSTSAIKEEKRLISTSGGRCSDSDSEDDKPLSSRLSTELSKGNSNHVDRKPNTSRLGSPPFQKPKVKLEDSDDEMPLSSKFQAKPVAGPSTNKSSGLNYNKTIASDDEMPLSSRFQTKPVAGPTTSKSAGFGYAKTIASDDEMPLSLKLKTKPVAGPTTSKSSGFGYNKTIASDDEMPLSLKLQTKPVAGPTTSKSSGFGYNKTIDSDDEMPLSSKLQTKPVAGPTTGKSSGFGYNKTIDSDDEMPLSSKLQTKPVTGPTTSKSSGFGYSKTVDSDDEMPLSSKLQTKPVAGPTKSMSSGFGYNRTIESDDEMPLSSKFQTKPVAGPTTSKSSGFGYNKMIESDDEMPLSSKFQTKPVAGASTSKSSSLDDRKPMAPKLEQNGSTVKDNQLKKSSPVLNKRPLGDVKSSSQSSIKRPKLSESSSLTVSKQVSVKAEPKIEDEDDDHIPISQRMKKPAASGNKSFPAKQKVTKVVSSSFKKTTKKSKKVVKKSKYSKPSKVPPGSGEGQKWTTLVHNGVIFPPPYKPHGVKILYKGQPVNLTPEQEEVATMYAVMLETDYMSKQQFKENFMSDWRRILGKNHVIQKLEDCDFTPIYEWHVSEREKKKQISTEEKKALKEEKLKLEEKYMWAVVDGVKEKVGNFRVEPPGLFRGRGEHPKMGKLKKRIRPRDITINIGRNAPIPECPIPGESWKEVRHDNTVTWLAYWNDPINPKEFKYVFLAASSSLKGQSDKEKYEKARLLKNYIQGIRTAYTRDFANKDIAKRQIAVATYLIDKLALRAGNEKDDDEAETVGCCTLKVENVEPVPPNILKFDFLGKDSIRYQNEVEVELPVFKAIQQFRTGKKGSDDLFDKLDTSKLNAHLKELMPGLTAKVFRTYNASITLDDMLSMENRGGDVTQNIVVYQHANKEVAIICNHQRTVSKSHSAQMTRLNEKIEELKGILDELRTDLDRAKHGKSPMKGSDGKPKRSLNREALEKKIAQTTAKIEKMERDKETKEDLKTVALGTSKINYLDPRISVAWCKRQEVPIEKIFNKSLLAKFAWAMDVEPSFRF